MIVAYTITCHHCGDQCPDNQITVHNHSFCCEGCKNVFLLLKDNNLANYYSLEKAPGKKRDKSLTHTYEYLDDNKIKEQLLNFSSNSVEKITLHLPQIHCSSCLWLLENINRLNPGIIFSRINFLKKEASIQYNPGEISLRQLIELLDKIGYPPHISLDEGKAKNNRPIDKKLYYQIGLAGFVFGNIMLLSFPEYLGFEKAALQFYIGYINILLVTPSVIFGAKEYLMSAWTSLKYKNLNLDVPVAMGVTTLYIRSIYEITMGISEGYLDSLAGFIFFLLIGKWFQKMTYHSLDFERTFKSYFPISSLVKSKDTWISKPVAEIIENDHLLIRNQEIIPVDGELISGTGKIDYSFVTGESNPVEKQINDRVLAGGKQIGAAIEIKAASSVNQSYLTQLWNEDSFIKKSESSTSKLINIISKYFTVTILLGAVATFIYWLNYGFEPAIMNFTSVLIVACPCALALAIPFTYGNILRLLSARGFHIKNTDCIHTLQEIDEVVFDKTGTITEGETISLKYEGKNIKAGDKALIRTATLQSNHPVSKALSLLFVKEPTLATISYTEEVGLGIHVVIKGHDQNHDVRIGSSSYVFGSGDNIVEVGTFVVIDNRFVGRFTTHHSLRRRVSVIIHNLRKWYALALISGDNDSDQQSMEALFQGCTVKFNQKPFDKLKHIQSIQSQNKKVMMVGDGLNDAGALKQSDIGVSIMNGSSQFTPASDIIVDNEAFKYFDLYIDYLRKSKYIIFGAFIIAFLYNAIGLAFAISGHLSPIVAAILMPLSSVSVVLYGVLSSTFLLKIYSDRMNTSL